MRDQLSRSSLPVYRFLIELRASTYPMEVWTPLQRPQGGKYRFVEEHEAETARDKLLAIQPQMMLRIVGC
jgi:hypothetical protein